MQGSWVRKAMAGGCAFAVSVLVGGTVSAGAAAPKPNASFFLCVSSYPRGSMIGTKTFTGGLTATPSKKTTVSFSGSSSGCVTDTPIGGAAAINNVVVSGVAKMKKATKSHFDNLNGAVMKVTVTFRNGATPVCVNKAKVKFNGYGPKFGGGLDLFGGLAQPRYTSAVAGGKSFGGKCFKGKTLSFSLVHDYPGVFLGSATSASAPPLTSLSYTGASPYTNEMGSPPIVPRFGILTVG
jgi:hypothetical protein